MSRLLSSPAAGQILALFTSAGLRAQLGFNMGTGLLSVTVKLPTRDNQRMALPSPSAAVVWSMLGLLHEQAPLERDYLSALLTGSLDAAHCAAAAEPPIAGTTLPADAAAAVAALRRLQQEAPATISPTVAAAIETYSAALSSKNKISASPAAATATSADALPSLRWLSLQHARMLATLRTLLGPDAGHPANTNSPTLHNAAESAASTAAAAAAAAAADSATTGLGPTPLLANRCLFLFARATGILPTRLQLAPRQGALTVVLSPYTDAVVSVRHPRSGAPPRLSFLLPRREVLHSMALIDRWEVEPPSHCAKGAKKTAAVEATATANTPDAKDGGYADIAPRRALFCAPYAVSDDALPGHRYGPLYALLSGYCGDDEVVNVNTNDANGGDSAAWSEIGRDVQRALLTSLLSRAFWAHVTHQLRYFPSPALVAQVTPVLAGYMAAGAATQTESFTPRSPLNVFLYGTAGTGKSTFVRVLADALRHLVSRAFEPAKRVEVTRVPLNQTSPAALAAMLSVRGISDWSIERIVEQALGRGGLALLHLEELPPAPELQTALFALMSRMAATLTSRYPEFRDNVVNLMTSNYPPAPALQKLAATVVITPPEPAAQARWAARTLEDLVGSNAAAVDPAAWAAVLSSTVSAAAASTATATGKKSANSSAVPIAVAAFTAAARARPPSFWQYPASAPFLPPVADSDSEFTAAGTVAVSGALLSGARPLLPLLSSAALPASFSLPGEAAGSPQVAMTQRLLRVSYLRFLLAFTFAQPPPHTADLRKLDTWKRSVGFSIVEHVYMHAAATALLAAADAAAANATGFTVAKSSGVTPMLSTFALRATIRLLPTASNSAHTRLEVRFTRLYAGAAHDAALRSQASNAAARAVLAEVLPPLVLQSSDRYFYFPISNNNSNSTAVTTTGLSIFARALPSPRALPHHALPRVDALSRMWVSNFLKPTVIVLTGPRRAVTAAAADVRRALHGACARAPTTPATARRLGPHEKLTVKTAAALSGASGVEHTSSTSGKSNGGGEMLVVSNIMRAAAAAATGGVLGAQSAELSVAVAAQADYEAEVLAATAGSGKKPALACGNLGVAVRSTGAVPVAAAFPTLAQDLGEDDLTPEGEDDALLCPSEAAAAFFSGAALGVAPYLPFATAGVPVQQDSAPAGSGSAALPALFEFFAVAMSERDRRVLFGDPDPATGALLRFISAVNAHSADAAKGGNGASANGSSALAPPAVGVVFAHASGKGQFMLRELLDAGDSTTHVTDVKKDRLLFVVCVAAEDVDRNAAAGDTAAGRTDGVQPQLVSRAHDVLPCGDGVSESSAVAMSSQGPVTVRVVAKL